MKSVAKIIVQKILEALVRIKLRRTRPEIIGITGSFGKTSTKEALYHVLRGRFRVYRNPKSLNTEFGLLLAILEQPSGFNNPLAWLGILIRACWNAFFGARYDVLILEYGADKPGDIGHLVSLVKPNIAIITHIARTHQAAGQFKNEEEVFNEKKKLAMCLGAKDKAILNGADPWLKKLNGELKAQVYWYKANKAHNVSPSGRDNSLASPRLGLGEKFLIYATGVANTKNGFEAVIHSGAQKIHAQFGIAGAYHINIILPTLACGVLHGVTLEEGIASLKTFKLPPGRMSIIPGRSGSTLLDSTYNASPETVAEAMSLLQNFPGKRKIAVLGNMNELGDFTETAHREIAKGLGKWLDMLITVGELAEITAHEALKNGLPQSKIKILSSAQEVGDFLASHGLHEGDVVLFKGSQNKVRLERAVKIVMKRPEDAKKLLCRQEKEWGNIM